MAGLRRAVAAGMLLAIAFPRASGALRIVEGSFQVYPAAVDLTRTITVAVALEDETGEGGTFTYKMEPRPAGLVRLLKEAGPWISCTSVEQTRGSWIYEALAPGEVSFHFSAMLSPCRSFGSKETGGVSASVQLNPPKVWSKLELSPRILAPGGEITLKLLLRNDSASEVSYSLPQAQPELLGVARAAAVETPEGMRIDPPGRARDNRLELAPGELVQATWTFIAREPGELRFLISGAGMVIMSPKVLIRHAPVLECVFPPLDEPGAVGKAYELAGRVRSQGETAIVAPHVYLSWTPAGAARLISSPGSATGAALSAEADMGIGFLLDLIEPGTLFLTVTAEGRESDTGEETFAQPVTLALSILPPPELDLELELESATAIVGSEIAFALRVINRGTVMAASLSPNFLVRRGRVSFKPLAPLFQSVPAGSTGVFRGSMVLEEEGEVELIAQISSRGRLGGSRAAAASGPERIMAVGAPVLEMYWLTERAHPGPGPMEFRLRNGGQSGFVLSRADLRLTGDGYALNADVLGSESLSLAPGKEAPIRVETDPPVAADPYWLLAGLQFTGRMGDSGLEFARSLSQRPVALICPRARRFVLVEPEGAFRPPLDPLLQIEWTTTVAGKSGLAVVTSAGQVARILRQLGEAEAGLHALQWYGETDKGGLVKPGNYILRLAGPASGTAIWPAGAAWAVDRPLEVGRP